MIQSSLVGAREVDLGLLARLHGLSISRRAEAPLVAGHHAGEHPLRVRRAEVVAHRSAEFEELFCRLDADRVPSFVILARATMTVSVEARADAGSAHVGAAAFEVAS